jgi:hypothetical protein
MWFSRFNFLLPALLAGFGSTSIGGVFVVLAWAYVVWEGVEKSRWNFPVPLFTLTAAVFLALISLQFLYLHPSDRFYAQADEIVGCCLFGSFTFVVATMFLLIWGAGYRKGMLAAGSIAALTFQVLGFIWYIFGK